jgi:adenylate kinase
MMEFPEGFNVLVTGTPGTGKTALCAMLESELGLRHIEVGKIVKSEHFYTEYDPAYDSYIVEEEDEERLLDFLEPVLVRGGCAVDYHSSELFPRRWFGLVVVLRAATNNIFDRLSARGYSDAKREENLDAEISGTCEEEARRSYHASAIVTAQSNTLAQMLRAVEVVRDHQARWTPERQQFVTLADIEDDDGDADGAGGGDEEEDGGDDNGDGDGGSGDDDAGDVVGKRGGSGGGRRRRGGEHGADAGDGDDAFGKRGGAGGGDFA